MDIYQRLCASLQKKVSTGLIGIIVLSLILMFFFCFWADKPVSQLIRSLTYSYVAFLVKIGNFIGDGWVLFLFLLFFYLLTFLLKFEKKSKVFKASLYSSIVAGIVSQVLKLIIKRCRPVILNDPLAFSYFLDVSVKNKIHGDVLNSMPSGHTMVIFAACVPLVLSTKNKFLKALLIFIPFITAFARLYTYAHWPSDIIIAILLGILIGYIFTEKIKNKPENIHAAVAAQRRIKIFM